jgi:hypothetical protein
LLRGARRFWLLIRARETRVGTSFLVSPLPLLLLDAVSIVAHHYGPRKGFVVATATSSHSFVGGRGQYFGRGETIVCQVLHTSSPKGLAC